ncbi:hypothetical protein Syun_023098 [Stephania yunnanensis]|uniref:Non-specific serine/threonine protein kinase n=1 Tax=Stephania yunnanensis TaxID=152371 RepID=A0AAP0FGR1_9MAGN
MAEHRITHVASSVRQWFYELNKEMINEWKIHELVMLMSPLQPPLLLPTTEIPKFHKYLVEQKPQIPSSSLLIKIYGGIVDGCLVFGYVFSLLSNGRNNNHGLTSGLVERFVGWALPLFHDIGGDGSVELALEGIREFLNVGEASGIKVYISPILKACQGLLENERTSLSLLHHLLGVLSLIYVKFARWFQPHFVDIIDLLLGWALVPDLSKSDRCVIMDSFLQFRKHWLNNLQFSLRLLSKFLDDMDVLLKDGSAGTPEQFQRLLTLVSCFLTVLKATATEMLEMNFLEQISEPLISMVPKLLSCLSLVGKKFGWSR